MKKVIHIPNVDRDERIGSAFNHLFQVIQQTDNCCMNDLCWDLSNTSFFHPFQGKHGYIFSQYLKKEDCIDLVLADDGITVLGSYVKAQKFLDEINGNDAEALRLANEGKSTKNLPNAENRGYGISSSKEMLSDGLHGSFFMLSGGAFHRHDSSGSVFVKLPNSIYWDGTIILMRIPVKVPLDFDYNKYTR